VRSWFPAPYLLDAAAAKLYHEELRGRLVVARRAESTTDKDAARKAGSSRRFAGGEQTIAIVAQFLGRQLRDALRARGRIEVSLHQAGAVRRHADIAREIVSVDANTIAPSWRFTSRINAVSKC